ncbi:trypsin-5-like [Lycorma delicatula]|uniref:trypsin-5-like n=1 Tax=Lycorma delicatula TaxID=130591 RepID=UPI003F50E069
MDFVKIFFIFSYLCYTLTAGHNEVEKYTAGIENFPSQVIVEIDRKPVCGGAIIGDNWILTAKSCIQNVTDVSKVKIRAGTSELGIGGAFHYVSKVVVYNFTSSFFTKDDADIGLIKVKSPFLYSSGVQWSAPAVDYLEEGSNIVIAGWGIRKSSSQRFLQQAKVKVISRDECQEKFEDKLNITTIMSCLVPLTSDDNACIGDVGSPVSVSGLTSAIVSNNQYCWDNQYPLVVTNIGNIGFFIAINLSEPFLRNEFSNILN